MHGGRAVAVVRTGLGLGLGVRVLVGVGVLVYGAVEVGGCGGGFTVALPVRATATSGPITAVSRPTSEGTTILGLRHHGSFDKLSTPLRACSEPFVHPDGHYPDRPDRPRGSCLFPARPVYNV
ncbi:hypothetical protein BL254_20445 [Protofrankia sp. BMG5.30]|nr:hypothetical protein BL254_20445 [Protofrankia sp. BMG5.30]